MEAETLSNQVGDIFADKRVCVCIPCHNEEATVANVVSGFNVILPDADIVVLDNVSNDRTAHEARMAGARVERVTRKGKGNVVAWIFANLEADVFVMVDGDMTYDPSVAPAAIRALIEENLDMVNIARIPVHESVSRKGHQWGNRLFQKTVHYMFGTAPGDMLSGYKVFSRRLAKSLPLMSSGFEIETEIIVHVLEMQVPWREFEAPYFERPDGSSSKLSTLRDGARILRFIVRLFKNEHPLAFFGTIAGALASLSLLLGVPVVVQFFETGLVPRFPTAFLAASLMIVATLSLAIGLVLDTVTAGRREMKRLMYMLYAPPR